MNIIDWFSIFDSSLIDSGREEAENGLIDSQISIFALKASKPTRERIINHDCKQWLIKLSCFISFCKCEIIDFFRFVLHSTFLCLLSAFCVRDSSEFTFSLPLGYSFSPGLHPCIFKWKSSVWVLKRAFILFHHLSACDFMSKKLFTAQKLV